jgi:ABC-type Fe3+/spermidine/putrescine transport system ATPase subunit
VIAVSTQDQWAEGKRAYLFVRPEDVSIVPASSANALLAGNVVSVAYLGEALRVTLDIGCGSVVARCTRDIDPALLIPGSRVGLTWSPLHMRLLHSEQDQ